METIQNVVSSIDGFLWGVWFLILLFGTHLFLTIRTGFIQRKIGLGIKLSITKDKDGTGDVSQFGALTTALAATIGTGNIVGVGTAVALGGPGAVLWMWLTGVFGIATKYAETLISVKYRVKDKNGQMLGGAMMALERGLKMKWLAVLFALFGALAAFGIGDGVQANSVATVIHTNFNIPMWVSGLILMILTGVVLIGGLKRVTQVCEALVPFMAIVYVLGCIVLLIMHHKYLGPAVAHIITYAFNPQAAGGGLLGYAVTEAARYGIARGLFSNESGMGSAPLVGAAAQTRNPARQALVSMTGTFWDTVVVCLMTGLVVVSSIMANPNIDYTDGAVLVANSFNQLGTVGSIILTFGLLTFAYSTILGWSMYGEKCAIYLLGTKIIIPYRVAYTAVVFIGCALSVNLAWDIADALNALMVLPNIIAMLLLSNVIAKDTKEWVYGGKLNHIDKTPIPTISELRKK